MSILPTRSDPPAQSNNAAPQDASTGKAKRTKRKGPNLNQIHANPLPLEAHPLPAFHPSNPISLIRLVYTWIADILFAPSSHPGRSYTGYFSAETRSVHVTDPRCARVLWQMGFFGKGTLSRSEPTWLEREKARLSKESREARNLAAEDVRDARREERKLFKLERARLEWEKIERQRLVEEGKLDPNKVDVSIDRVETQLEDKPTEGDDEDLPTVSDSLPTSKTTASQNGNIDGPPKVNGHLRETKMPENHESQLQLIQNTTLDETLDAALADEEKYRGRTLEEQEHLQLTLEESFFLCYGLGVLSIYPPKRRAPSPLSVRRTPEPYATTDLLELFCQYSSFPPADSIWITPDDQFLLNYVAYHHFRSLGWVVRPGIKFSVDYLLYNRGPAFSHAEFAVLIIPSYTDRYWNTPGGRARRRVQEQKDWWWLHCVNRVQSQVFKTLVLCYIDIPSELDLDFDEGIDVGKLLRSYKVREFVLRRWLPNRSRD